MADSKKEWANKSLLEKAAQIGINVGVILIALVATAFAYWIKQPCDIDKQYLYCHTHPGNIFTTIGTILFWIGAFILSEIWLYFTEDDDTWTTIVHVGWGIGVAGMLMVVLF